jgi:glutaminyl-peptide cyclotransferase
MPFFFPRRGAAGLAARLLLLALALGGTPALAETSTPAPKTQTPAALTFQVLAQYPHDVNRFTQGLEIAGGALYESSGLYGRSFIVRGALPQVQTQTQAPMLLAPAASDTRQPLPSRYFGEGLTVWDERIYVVTWRERRGLIFERASLQPAGEFAIEGEGWGLTHDSKHLILSDGTAVLRFLDPKTFAVQKTVTVHSGGQPLAKLNELEWVEARKGRPARLLANVWGTDELVAIDPADGRVTARLDLARLYPHDQRSRRADVMNGIAWDARDDTLLITGKFWPYLYRLKLLQPLP